MQNRDLLKVNPQDGRRGIMANTHRCQFSALRQVCPIHLSPRWGLMFSEINACCSPVASPRLLNRISAPAVRNVYRTRCNKYSEPQRGERCILKLTPMGNLAFVKKIQEKPKTK